MRLLTLMVLSLWSGNFVDNFASNTSGDNVVFRAKEARLSLIMPREVWVERKYYI